MAGFFLQGNCTVNLSRNFLRWELKLYSHIYCIPKLRFTGSNNEFVEHSLMADRQEAFSAKSIAEALAIAHGAGVVQCGLVMTEYDGVY